MHTLTLGITRSGKSTLAKQRCNAYRRQGIHALVLDPHGTKWPGVEDRYVFQDPLKFLEIAKKAQRCALFVDEAGESIGKGKHAREMQWVTTGSAKYGHVAHLICQSAVQLDTTIRGQCGRLFTFKQSERNAKLLADDFAEPLIMEATTLERFHFLDVISCGPVKRYKLTI